MICKKKYKAIKMIWNPETYDINFEEEKTRAIKSCIEDMIADAEQDGSVLETFSTILSHAEIEVVRESASMIKIKVSAKIKLYVS